MSSFGVAHEMSERVDHGFAIADQRFARAGLHLAVAQERDQRRDENEVGRSRLAHTLHGGIRNVGVVVIEQRDQQPLEPFIGNVAESAGDVAAGGPRCRGRIGDDVHERVVGGIDIRFLQARGQSESRRRPNPRVRFGQQRPRVRDRVFMTDGCQRAKRRGADAGVSIRQRTADLRRPALRRVGPERTQRPLTDGRRLVIEEERRDQVALVERFEDVYRVDDSRRFGIRELLHQCLDRAEVGDVQTKLRRGQVAPLDALSECGQVSAAGADRHEDPQHHHGETRIAQALPVETQAPGFDQHEQEKRTQRLCVPVHGDVDERLGLELDVLGQREKQDLAGRLVNGVAKRLVEHAREPRRPEAGVEQHDDRARSQADRQHHQREADAQIAVDLAGQPHLDDETGDIDVHRWTCARKTVMASVAP